MSEATAMFELQKLLHLDVTEPKAVGVPTASRPHQTCHHILLTASSVTV